MGTRNPIRLRQGFGGQAAIAAFLLALAGAAFVNVRTSAQAGRPPDLAGEWRLDNAEDPGQPPLADYLGIAFNEAGRLRADTTPESIWGTPEYQCRPHSAPHQWRGVGGARILKDLDPISREITGYRLQFMRSLDRPIFLDGRPHPPAWAPHSWSGFSTGEWIGHTLKVTTTHLKDGYLKRGGPQTSDMLTMTEFITRHDDILTIVQVVDDPIYLDEPYVLSITYTIDPNAGPNTENCSGSSFAENGGRDRHWVPHFLPGQNSGIGEFLKTQDWIPLEPVRGGVKTLYPEYRAVLGGTTSVANLTVPSSRSANDVAKRIADQGPKDGQVHVLPVQGNIYMLVADGTNIAASVGKDGIAVVNTGPQPMSDKVLTALNELARVAVNPPTTNKCFGANCPGQPSWSSPYFNAVVASPRPAQPIRYVINTSAAPEHVGGNEKLAASATFRRGGTGSAFGGAAPSLGQNATVVAHEEVLARMSTAGGKTPAAPAAALPNETFFDEFHKLSEYVNGEPVILYHAPAANTDGDSFVFFRHSEVISAGNLFSTISYPLIDVAKGGTLQGVIDGLNHILDLAVAEYRAQGGTWIIPGRGRLSDTADVASYRNMLVMIRDRVRDLMKKGMTLEQVKAARPTLDFDGRYGASTGAWTTDMFVEAAYRSLQEKK
jgi:glyoxylase-like metal-dependent hydrolase (beta-lactamase superfamily II)